MWLTGWRRLGVIASIIFFGVVFVYQLSQRTNLSAQMANIDRQVCKKEPGATDEMCGVLWQQKFEHYYETHTHWSLLSAALPIPVAWVLAWIILSLYRWVRRGFLAVGSTKSR